MPCEKKEFYIENSQLICKQTAEIFSLLDFLDVDNTNSLKNRINTDGNELTISKENGGWKFNGIGDFDCDYSDFSFTNKSLEDGIKFLISKIQ